MSYCVEWIHRGRKVLHERTDKIQGSLLTWSCMGQ